MEKYGLVGEKLKHSFSPMIHSLLYDYDYRLYEVERNGLADFMHNTDLKAFNVTIPYKQKIIPFCAGLSDSALKIGSVNTVIRKADGSFWGDNTDYYGFEYLIKASGISISGKKAVILGNGGASKTVQAVLKSAAAHPIIVISRGGENNYDNLCMHYDAQIIVNTTPVGMYPNNGSSAIHLTSFKKCELVLDLIYNPHKTSLLLQAENMGIPAFNGLQMLVAQAKKAAEIFTSTSINEDLIEKIANTISINTMNIALIGMPGCGKTTIGQQLAELTGRELIDIDEEIEKYTGITIPEIFNGQLVPDLLLKDNILSAAEQANINKLTPEQIFRKIETYVLSEVSKRNGIIISTGGGIVTIPENKKLLNQNSKIILIERPLSELSTNGRPLSLSKGIENLYSERHPLYLQWCDFKVENSDPHMAAETIIKYLNK